MSIKMTSKLITLIFSAEEQGRKIPLLEYASQSRKLRQM